MQLKKESYGLLMSLGIKSCLESMGMNYPCSDSEVAVASLL